MPQAVTVAALGVSQVARNLVTDCDIKHYSVCQSCLSHVKISGSAQETSLFRIK